MMHRQTDLSEDGSNEDGITATGARDASSGTLNSGKQASAAGPSSRSDTSLGFTSPPNVSCSLSRHDLSQRFSSVPGAAHDRTLHPALVRRRARRLDHLPAVLPGLPAGWLRVRALAGLARERAGSGGCPHVDCCWHRWRFCRCTRTQRSGNLLQPPIHRAGSCSC